MRINAIFLGFWAATAAYLFALIHIGISFAREDISIFGPFGAPAGLLLFALFVSDRLPFHHTLAERLGVFAAGLAAELLRGYWMATYYGPVVPMGLGGLAPLGNDYYFQLKYGFGLSAAIVATLWMWLKLVVGRRPEGAGARRFVGILMLLQVFLLYNMFLVSRIPGDPVTYDAQFHGFDATLGWYIPSEISRLLTRFPMLEHVSLLAYGMLAAAVLLAYVLQERLPKPPPTHILVTCALAGACSVLYYFFPACGPLQVFGALYPDAVPMQDYTEFTRTLDSRLYRNAMPSLHTTWGLLVWIHFFFYFASPVIRVAATVYTLLLLLGTIGFGEHYFVDMVVAVPLTLAVQALPLAVKGLHRPQARQYVATGLALLGGWLLLCVYPQIFNVYTAWGSILFTLALCGGLLFRLMTAVAPQQLSTQPTG